MMSGSLLGPGKALPYHLQEAPLKFVTGALMKDRILWCCILYIPLLVNEAAKRHNISSDVGKGDIIKSLQNTK